MKYIYTLILLILISGPSFAQEDSPIEVTADEALEWDRANQTFIATGNAVVTQGDGSIKAPSITAYYDEGESIQIQKVVAKTNAVLEQPDETLTANIIEAQFNDGALSTVTATDNVVLKADTETLYGDKAVYNALDRIITVTGEVRIEQDRNVVTGNKATYDLKTNISTMTASKATGGRVKATFYSNGDQ